MHALQRLRLPSLPIVALLLPLLGTAPVSAQPTEFKVGISDPVNTVLAIWMADAAGLYAANGLKVEIINMNGGSRGAAELAAGRIDAMHVGLSSVVRLNRTGGDLRIIASLANVIRFAFVSAPDVKTAADLKGGVVGVSTFGSESDSTVTLALKRLGLSRDDVTLKEYGGGPRRLAAREVGRDQSDRGQRAVHQHGARAGLQLAGRSRSENIPWLFTAIVVRRGSIAERRDVLTRFIRATAEGNYLALTDETKAKAVLARQPASAIRKSSTSATTTSSCFRRRTSSRPPRGKEHPRAVPRCKPEGRGLCRQRHPRWPAAGRCVHGLGAEIQALNRRQKEWSMALKFRVELVWEDETESASSIYLTSDGRVILQGRAISPRERETLSLPADGEMISVDRNLIRAIKEML